MSRAPSVLVGVRNWSRRLRGFTYPVVLSTSSLSRSCWKSELAFGGPFEAAVGRA